MKDDDKISGTHPVLMGYMHALLLHAHVSLLLCS